MFYFPLSSLYPPLTVMYLSFPLMLNPYYPTYYFSLSLSLPQSVLLSQSPSLHSLHYCLSEARFSKHTPGSIIVLLYIPHLYISLAIICIEMVCCNVIIEFV